MNKHTAGRQDWIGLALLAASLGTMRVAGAPFAYQSEDLVLGMRQAGSSAELVVDLGPAALFYGAAPGASFSLTGVTPALLTAAFSSLNGVLWSVSGDVRSDTDPAFPVQTLWVTKARDNLTAQTAPWLRQSQFSLGATASRISSLGNGAVTYSATQPPGANNTTNAVVLPAGDPNAYSSFVGNGNFQATFQGNAENTTPDNFTTAGAAARSDLYQVLPGSGATLNTPATYLGYFELKPNGSLTFYAAGGTTVPNPTISSITHTNSVTSITFTTVAGAHYSLVGTDLAGLRAPLGQWTTLGSPVAGTGSTMTLQETNSAAARVYVIQATK